LQKKNQREIIAKRNLCNKKKVPQKHSAKEFMQKKIKHRFERKNPQVFKKTRKRFLQKKISAKSSQKKSCKTICRKKSAKGICAKNKNRF
jgi:hypothetical protein